MQVHHYRILCGLKLINTIGQLSCMFMKNMTCSALVMVANKV